MTLEDVSAAATPTGTITALRPARGAKDRVSVEINGAPAFTLSADLAASERLEAGDRIDAGRAAALLAADEAARATNSALAFLAYRPRSEKEVRDRLRRGGFGHEAIEQTIAKLHDWRYLDDADFARRWVESRSSGRPRGSRLLRQELWQKGIDRETAAEAIDEAEIDEETAAEALARERLRIYAGEERPVIRRRLSAYLSRRGYSYEVVRGALERVLDDDEDEASNSLE